MDNTEKIIKEDISSHKMALKDDIDLLHRIISNLAVMDFEKVKINKIMDSLSPIGEIIGNMNAHYIVLNELDSLINQIQLKNREER